MLARPIRKLLAKLCSCFTAEIEARWFIALTGCLVLSVSCSLPTELARQRFGTYPFFIDDSAFVGLSEALDQHISYLKRLPPGSSLPVGSQTAPVAGLTSSLTSFRQFIETKPDLISLNQFIRTHFEVFTAAGRKANNEMLVTGYYYPVFNGSLKKDATYRFPLYRLPPALLSKTDSDGKAGQPGRLSLEGAILPFWTRSEIENDNTIAGSELVYLENPFDAYLLHVQGSGRIRLPDGSIRGVHYAGSNGHVYRSLGKLFVDRNILAKEEVSVPRMRTYFQQHPENLIPMLHHNPRYIFFAWSQEAAPRGSLGVPLTPGRSIAIDHALLPTGAIGYLVSRRPVLNRHGKINHWRTFGRFVLPQDSGSAIKGPGRVDVYWGSGQYAELAAGHMNETGTLYFLMQNNFAATSKIR